MNVLIVLIPVSLLLVLLAVQAYTWAVRSGQFEQLDDEASRILFESRRRNPK